MASTVIMALKLRSTDAAVAGAGSFIVLASVSKRSSN
jgi:hypothetical protein